MSDIFVCGICQDCEHKWDGAIWKSEDGLSESVTCSNITEKMR